MDTNELELKYEEIRRNNCNNLTEEIFFNLIDFYQNKSEEKNERKEEIKLKIQSIRKQYLFQFIPKEEFWLSWINDTIIEINNNNTTQNEVYLFFLFLSIFFCLS